MRLLLLRRHPGDDRGPSGLRRASGVGDPAGPMAVRPLVRPLDGQISRLRGRTSRPPQAVLSGRWERVVQRLMLCESEHVPSIRQVRNLFAIVTGARAGKIGALRWEDVDLEVRVPTATIFRQVQFTGLKGSPIFKDPKRRSHRILSLHPSAASALRWWKEKGWKESRRPSVALWQYVRR